jgi:hypothetical protein
LNHTQHAGLSRFLYVPAPNNWGKDNQMDIAQLFHHRSTRLPHQEGNLRPTGSVEVRPCLYLGETSAQVYGLSIVQNAIYKAAQYHQWSLNKYSLKTEENQ